MLGDEQNRPSFVTVADRVEDVLVFHADVFFEVVFGYVSVQQEDVNLRAQGRPG